MTYESKEIHLCECDGCRKKIELYIKKAKEEIREKTQSLDKGAVDMAY